MSRMEKYDSTAVKSRTLKNEKLYEKTSDLSVNYDYIDVNNAIELNPTEGTSSRENYQKQRELNSILRRPREENKQPSQIVRPKEDRIYDINELLAKAKDNTEENIKPNEKQSKRLINTEYNILTKLDLKDLDKENYRKEDLRSLINDIYEKEEPKKMKNIESKDDDNLFKDLLDDNDNGSDLIDDLNLKEELAKDILEKNKDETGTVPITEEIKDIENKEIPESYHEKENEEEMFIFDDLKEKKKKNKKEKKKKDKHKYEEINEIIKEEAEKEDGIDYDKIEKDGRGILIAIIVIVILIILTVLFFLYEYFYGI